MTEDEHRLVERVVLQGARIVDTELGRVGPPSTIYIDGGRVASIRHAGEDFEAGWPIKHLRGAFVLPGLIDVHVHVAAWTTRLADLGTIEPSLATAKAKVALHAMLLRGFTSARDAGGADRGLADAVELGHFSGPRLFVSGRALAMTGGQGDFRARGSTRSAASLESPMCRVVDGVDAIRSAVREEFRRGAHQLKLMAGGGLAGGVDTNRAHFSSSELEVAVEEATAAGSYAMAHAYSPDAITRAVRAGVRTVEHGNLLNRESADVMAEAGAILVPTLSVYQGYSQRWQELGVSEAARDSAAVLLERGLESLEIARAAGVAVGFGTDLEGILQPAQHDEFKLRTEGASNAQILRSATHVNAQILGMVGEVGAIKEGALADLVVVDRDPLDHLQDIFSNERSILGVMKGGHFYKEK